MADSKPTRFAQELGRAMCDRLGLVHDSTLMDWKTERMGMKKTVMVTMTTVKFLPIDEYHELLRVAEHRATEATA